MSGYRPAPYLEASIGPRACVLLRRVAGEQLELMARWAARMESSPDPENRAAAAEVWRFLDGRREAERQYHQRGGSSDCGTSELPKRDERARSPVSLLGPSAMSVGEVAEQLRVSRRYVTRLCAASRLSATKQGGVWFIDRASVADYQARRPA